MSGKRQRRPANMGFKTWELGTYVERYNRTVRHEWLGQYIFETIEEAQDHATRWLDIQQRAAQHGHWRHHTRNETENSGLKSSFKTH
jgi:hypothetical protein